MSGQDSGDFFIGNPGNLAFVKAPDYEIPPDGNTDNVYEVTIQASAGTDAGTLDVAITVTNVDEEGRIILSPPPPVVGEGLTPTLSDPDGNVCELTWQWASDTSGDGSYAEIAGAVDMTWTTTGRLTRRRPSRPCVITSPTA